MLFSSFQFLFAFLPLVIFSTWLAGRLVGNRAAMIVLIGSSALFVAWRAISDLTLLLVSVVFNLIVATLIMRSTENFRWRPTLLVLGITCNVALLTLYKIPPDLWHRITGILNAADSSPASYVLPIAISFYTFHQINFLIDTANGGTRAAQPLSYALFVMFFPQLIAGPIVRWHQVENRIGRIGDEMLDPRLVVRGMMMMIIGLAKKVLIADPMSALVGPIYTTAATGMVSCQDAWAAAFGFMFQIYFDFSAYSDIAVGLGLLFGIFLPVNFLSPLKSRTFMELWQTWHITLCHFLRDNLYNNIGGKSRRLSTRAVAIFVTLLISGLWHGMATTFVLFGAIHGLLLAFSQARRHWFGKRSFALMSSIGQWRARAIVVLTFALTLVIFRSPDLTTAGRIYQSMVLSASASSTNDALLWIAILGCLGLVWMFPNAADLAGQAGTPRTRDNDNSPDRINLGWAVLVGILAGAVIVRLWGLNSRPEFIYFAF